MRGKERLTARGCETVKPGAKVRMIPDGGSLYLRVAPAGSKSWVYRYRDQGRVLHEIGLGSLTKVPLADARRLAAQCRIDRGAGVDPIEKRHSERRQRDSVPSFAACAADYIERHRPGWKSSKYADDWESTLGRLSFKDKPVDKVDTQDILKAITEWAGRHKTQKDVVDRIRIILDAAGAAGHRDPTVPNPGRWKGHLEHLVDKRPKGSKQHHATMPYQELPAFMVQLRAREGMDARALEFAILTAARTGEVIGARWSEIDLERRRWVIPPERMKGSQEHVVPLSGPAIALLEALPRTGVRVFPRLDRHSLYVLLTRKMGFEGITVHGLCRSTFATWAQEADVPRDLREMALAHAEGDKVAAAYAHSKLVELRHGLMERWAAFCSGEVVPLRRVS